MIQKVALSLVFVFFLAGCAEQQSSPEVLPVELKDLVELPATFIGQIPCDDCERVDIVLNVRPDFIYQLRKTYQSSQGPIKADAQMGHWRFSPDDNLLILGKQKGLLKTYMVAGNDTIRFVEWEGTDKQSQIQYDLVRSLDVDPFEDVVKLRGMFSVRDGMATFTECSSAVSFTVDRGGVYETTLQNFLNTPHDQDQPVLVSLLGRVLSGASSEGSDDRILIDQLRRFYPNLDCEGNIIKASLTGPYWTLTEIDGTKVDLEVVKNIPYLAFQQNKTLHGHGGCNNFSGTYLVKGDVFLFQLTAMTRVACSERMDLENRFLRMLNDSETYRVENDNLTLLDQKEQVRARFIAGP